MIRRLIILLLIVGVFAHEEMGELEKEMLYKQNDRSPLLAGLCALTPTMGHLYVGKLSDRLKIKYLLSPPILLLPLAPPISLALFGHSDPHIGVFYPLTFDYTV